MFCSDPSEPKCHNHCQLNILSSTIVQKIRASVIARVSCCCYQSGVAACRCNFLQLYRKIEAHVNASLHDERVGQKHEVKKMKSNMDKKEKVNRSLYWMTTELVIKERQNHLQFCQRWAKKRGSLK
jgi:hypothetical protein